MRSAFFACVCVFAIVGCDGATNEDPLAAADSSVAIPVDAAPQKDAVPACIAKELPREIQIDFDGDIRNVILEGPINPPSTPVPLVINFHGYSDSASLQEGFSLMSEHARSNEYVVAYPEGTGIIKGWNAGACCGTAVTSAKKDVEFTERVIEAVAELACIDLARVYAVGYSNGGFLSHRLACELSDKIAGIGSVAGVMGTEDCQPSHAIPVLQMHGTADAVVPYNGSIALGFVSVARSMADWSDRLHCDATEPSVFYDEGDATCVRYSGCDAPLGLCTIAGGGHTWPGGTTSFGRGKVSSDLNANELMMQFFQSAP